jgi:hypothetical protein
MRVRPRNEIFQQAIPPALVECVINEPGGKWFQNWSAKNYPLSRVTTDKNQ